MPVTGLNVFVSSLIDHFNGTLSRGPIIGTTSALFAKKFSEVLDSTIGNSSFEFDLAYYFLCVVYLLFDSECKKFLQ